MAAEEKNKAVIQERIRLTGKCVAGYDWIHKPNERGYRCAGGSHFLTYGEIGVY
ncbi:hypothetical protein K474DRAFT_1659181 [Panus rudis PR-1116 ss-1]|nr:hypothetical protein K474DRAFT_1659181 [Panus rudis PR-1116 ss-1]